VGFRMTGRRACTHGRTIRCPAGLGNEIPPWHPTAKPRVPIPQGLTFTCGRIYAPSRESEILPGALVSPRPASGAGPR
jgi:hypothetical protein